MNSIFIHYQGLVDSTIDGIELNQCVLKGYISNEDELRQKLALDTDNIQQLLNGAANRWGKNINQHLLGDYILVWLTPEQLLVTSSARSSYTVFYQQNDMLKLTDNLTQLSISSKTQINESQWLQDLALGPIASSNTCFDSISKVQSGETLTWQLSDCAKLSHQQTLSHTKQLELAHQTHLPTAQPLPLQAKGSINATALFSSLPSLAHRLGEPVIDAALAHFDQMVVLSDSDVILLDKQWLDGRNIIGSTPFYTSHRWCKGILKKPMSRQEKQLNKQQNLLVTAYEAAQESHNMNLTFSQWFDLHYVLPAWCQLLQRICDLHNKTLINPYLRAEQAMPLILNAKPIAPQHYFSLAQVSLANAYDAMQRLFYSSGNNITRLFNLNPSVSASLIKQRVLRPRRVEQLCVQLLTFDYLDRFHHKQLK
jgi:hypothetical protein